MQPVIAWAERALVETDDGRIFDCCEFELIPDVENRKVCIYGLMGWEMKKGMTIEDCAELTLDERQSFYETGDAEIIGYEPFNSALFSMAGFLSHEFMNMTASRSTSEAFWAS